MVSSKRLASSLKLYKTNKGQRPQVEHTEIEEELHEKANIDYDRVAIVRLQSTQYTVFQLLTLLARLPTRPFPPSTKMLSSMKLVLPSPPQELYLHTLEPKPAVLPQTSVL